MATVPVPGTCEAHVLESGATCAHAASVAHCNQLATALRLPVTHPVLTHSTDFPAGLPWVEYSRCRDGAKTNTGINVHAVF
eukprot:6453482-Amphidinium_carterae.1